MDKLKEWANPRRHAKSVRITILREMEGRLTFGRVYIQLLPVYHKNGFIWSPVWEKVLNSFLLERLGRSIDQGLKLIQETIETIRKIREHIWTTQSRQKSYADRRRWPLELDVSDQVFLKVPPTKGIRRFGVRGKLSARYTEPYEIIEKLNLITYQLDFPINLEHMHNLFHVSQLTIYVPDPDHAIITQPIEVTTDLAYEERLE